MSDREEQQQHQRSRARGRLQGVPPRRPPQTPYDRPERGRGRDGSGGRPPHHSRPEGGQRPPHHGRPDGSQRPPHHGRPDGSQRPPHHGRPEGGQRPTGGSNGGRPERSSYSQPLAGSSRYDRPPGTSRPHSSYSRDTTPRPPHSRGPSQRSSYSRPDAPPLPPPSSYSRPPLPPLPPPSSYSRPPLPPQPPLPSYSGGGAPSTSFAPPVQQEPAAMEIAQFGDVGSGEGAGRGRGTRRRGIEMYQPDPVVKPSASSGLKYGKGGMLVELHANYFKIETVSNISHNQYHVDFIPDVENIRERKRLLYVHREIIGPRSLFDGASLFTTVKLHNEITEFTSNLRSDNSEIKIKVKFIRQLSPRDPMVLQMLNIQMRKNMVHLDFKLIRGEYYDLRQACVLEQQRIELIPGFVTAIRQHEEGLLMCVDLAFKSIRQETVLSIIANQYRRDPNNFRQNTDRLILGKTVMTRYNDRTYRVAEIAWDMNPTGTFPKKDGSQISYMDYYQQRGIVISDPGQPLLMIKPSAKDIKRGMINPIYLLPEFCLMTGYDDDMKSDFNTMRAIADHMRIKPKERVNRMEEFVRRVNSNNNVREEMRERGFSIKGDIISVQGRQFPPEPIITSMNPSVKPAKYDANKAEWSEKVRGQRLLDPVRIVTWLLVYTRRDEQLAQNFYDNLKRVCTPMEMIINTPTMILIADDRTTTINQTLTQNIRDAVQLVVVVVSNNNKERYDCIKKICCVDYGVPSQVVIAKTLSRPGTLMSVATKIAIQMNCKLGGAPWSIRNPFPKTKIMVVGIDTYKDSAQRAKSACAIVCTMNNLLTKFYSQVAFQDPKQEMSDAFVSQLSSAFKMFREMNQELPSVLFFYRDGVGDGQLPQVREWEIKQIYDAIRKQKADYNPRIIFIIVNKRINTRFFLKERNFFNNPLAGTVIDRVVTRPERYDFFLVSQSVTQGTVAPTQYNVLLDTSGLEPEKVQLFTYKMAHIYYNWQGTIRVPAPVQYAHKFAFLVGQSLHTQPHERLANNLYYL